MTACGSDSTGPSTLDAASALKSLALGLQLYGENGTTATLDTDASFGGIAPFLNQVTVNIDGSSQTMFGLALHETFPQGTCWETIFTNVLPTDPSECTPPPLGLAVMLWQSHSASEVPDRMVLLAGDVGTSNFAFDVNATELPAVAIYVRGEKLWLSESGTLTSAVTASPQTCDVPLPLYAKSGTCTFATFDEQGSISLADFEAFDGPTVIAPPITLSIPRQTLHGLWMQISEVQPIGLTADRVVAPSVLRLLRGGLFSTGVPKTRVGSLQRLHR